MNQLFYLVKKWRLKNPHPHPPRPHHRTTDAGPPLDSSPDLTRALPLSYSLSRRSALSPGKEDQIPLYPTKLFELPDKYSRVPNVAICRTSRNPSRSLLAALLGRNYKISTVFYQTALPGPTYYLLLHMFALSHHPSIRNC